jgi:Wiskott-Aldrich syndrome protein
MAAIRLTGGIGALKKGGSLRHASSTPNSIARSASMQTNSKADMASSLAAVLQQRKSAMQSDDDEDDDDDDWK